LPVLPYIDTDRGGLAADGQADADPIRINDTPAEAE
jgi:hypothetical protein